MVPTKKSRAAWPFGRKFALWLEDHGSTLNAFALRSGLKQRTLHGWVKEGVRVPSDGLAKIAAATRLPADYWLDETIPYPPPMEYENLAESVTRALQAVPIDELREILALVSDPDDRRRTLALRRAARGS